jgi:hypothetical protein
MCRAERNDVPTVLKKLVLWLGATIEVIGAAKEGVSPKAQIRQTAEDVGADRAVENSRVLRRDVNSQQSRACAIVVINSRPMHKEAPELSNLRDAVDRGVLVISRKIS